MSALSGISGMAGKVISAGRHVRMAKPARHLPPLKPLPNNLSHQSQIETTRSMKHTQKSPDTADQSYRNYQSQPVYWTLKRFGGRTAEDAARHKASIDLNPFPHNGLCWFGFDSPQKLIEHLRTLGWKTTQFTNTTDQFARVETTELGFNVLTFPSYAAAVASVKYSPDAPLPECPFCLKNDRLERLEWSAERADGSDYEGPAVRCNRCDAVAPAAAWLAHGLAASGEPEHVACE